MKGTPLVLTDGARCIKQGYGFHWPPWSREPYFELPVNGKKVFLKEENGCAYLDDKDLICNPKVAYGNLICQAAPGKLIPSSSSDPSSVTNPTVEEVPADATT